MGALGFIIGAIIGVVFGGWIASLNEASRKGDELNELIYQLDYEKCVLCGKHTNIPVMMPISERAYYVECCGQLCPECYQKVYGGQHNG